MFRRRIFIPPLPAREWIVILLCGVCLGLLLGWLQKRFQLDPRLVRRVLLAAGALLLLWLVLLMAAYVKELRREEDEWTGRDDRDAD